MVWRACGQCSDHDSDPELQAPGKLAKTTSLQVGVSPQPTECGPDPQTLASASWRHGWKALRVAVVPTAGQVRPAGHLQAWPSELAHTSAGEGGSARGHVQHGRGGRGLRGGRLRWTEGLGVGGQSPEWMEPHCRDRDPSRWSGWRGPSPAVVKQPLGASTPQTPPGAGPSGAGWGTGSSRTPSARGPKLGRGHGRGVPGVGRARGACGPGFGYAGPHVQLPPRAPGSAGRDDEELPPVSVRLRFPSRPP